MRLPSWTLVVGAGHPDGGPQVQRCGRVAVASNLHEGGQWPAHPSPRMFRLSARGLVPGRAEEPWLAQEVVERAVGPAQLCAAGVALPDVFRLHALGMLGEHSETACTI